MNTTVRVCVCVPRHLGADPQVLLPAALPAGLVLVVIGGVLHPPLCLSHEAAGPQLLPHHDPLPAARTAPQGTHTDNLVFLLCCYQQL